MARKMKLEETSKKYKAVKEWVTKHYQENRFEIIRIEFLMSLFGKSANTIEVVSGLNGGP